MTREQGKFLLHFSISCTFQLMNMMIFSTCDPCSAGSWLSAQFNNIHCAVPGTCLVIVGCTVNIQHYGFEPILPPKHKL